jgi:hypothetical protein
VLHLGMLIGTSDREAYAAFIGGYSARLREPFDAAALDREFYLWRFGVVPPPR